jgi:hypothetical protein
MSSPRHLDYLSGPIGRNYVEITPYGYDRSNFELFW